MIKTASFPGGSEILRNETYNRTRMPLCLTLLCVAIMNNQRRANSEKSSDQPRTKTRAKDTGKSEEEQRDPLNNDRKHKPAKCAAADSCDQSAPTTGIGKRQSRKQTDRSESQDKPATSKCDEDPSQKRANGHRQSKKLKKVPGKPVCVESRCDRQDEPPQTSDSKSAEQRPPVSTRGHKCGSNIETNLGEANNDSQENAKQTDPRKCQRQDEPEKIKQDENNAPKRAKANRQSKKQKASSIQDRDESPHMSERKSTQQRATGSRRTHKSGPNTDSIGEAQGPMTDAHESAKSGRQSKKPKSQKTPATSKCDKNPAPKRTNNDLQIEKDHSSEDKSPELSRSGSMTKRRPKLTKTQSSGSVNTDSTGERQILDNVRPQITTDKLNKVLLANIRKLKIKKDERSEAAAYVNEITETVISHLKRTMSWCEDIERLTTGSYYENVKICEPDEFDVMLTIPVGRVDIQKLHDKEAFYSVALKRHPKHFLDKFLNEDRTIRASEMLNEFRDGIKKAVDSLPYKIVVQRKKQRCPAVTLQVTVNGKEISLDFVLGLKVHGSWPANTQNGFNIKYWLSGKEKTELKRQPYYLVPKYEGKGNADHDGVVAKDAWRISFSHIEKHILKRHGNTKTCCESKGQKCCRKECLKLLKYLLSQLKLKEMHSEKMSKFCSYHAKTTLLHACVERVEDSKWAYSQLADCFQELLDDFVRFLKTQNLPNFFVPSHNLLNPEYVPKSSCDFLVNEIEFQRNNNFPIFQ